MHNFPPCGCKDHEGAEIHYEEEIEINYTNLDESALRDAADQFICCPKCHCHPPHSVSMTLNNGANKTCLGTGLRSDLAAAAAALLPPGTKKFPASNLNHFHCLGHSCFNHKHPNHRVNHHQVKMRLKEKTKKKLQGKQHSDDPAVTIESLENAINQAPLISKNNQSLNNPTPSTTVSPTTNPGEASNASACLSKPTASHQPETNQKQAKASKTSTNQVEKEDLCTKEDDCSCPDCLQRKKIAEELIAEEESSKKKKQKKKKSKSKPNKGASNTINETSEVVKNPEVEAVPPETVEKPPSPTSNVPSSKPDDTAEENCSKTASKKNKKNKQQNHQTASSEPKPAAPAVTEKESNPLNGKRTKENKTGSVIVEQDPTSVDIQQWIKVKNKNKVQNALPDAWIANLVNQEDDNKNAVEEDHGQCRNEHSSISNNSARFKVIQNDKRRMSSNEKSENHDNSVSNDGCLSRMANLNPVGMASKAKLMSIEAQIAFNKNELKGAVQYISEALEMDPKNPVYYINRAFYHERLCEYEHALKDCESAMRFDETKEYMDHILCINAKALAGIKQYEQAESQLMQIRTLPHKPNSVPFIEKDLLLLRLKWLVSRGYTLPLARLYASKFPTMSEALAAVEKNCQILIEKKLNDSDPKFHLILIANKDHQQPLNFQTSTYENQMFETEAKKYTVANPVDSYDDDEIYFSDDEERDILYSDTDKWQRPKDILKNYPAHFEDAKEPPNSKGQKALWIGNVSPSCSLPFVTNLFMKFGTVTFCKIFPNEQRTNDLAYLLLHYDNDISPRLVMSYFKDKIIPGISKDSSCPLVIRFRNKNDKADDSGNLSDNYGANGSPSSGQSSSGGTHSPSAKSTSECYYWRTTGCDRFHCTFRHVAANKGIDKQIWMRKKN